MDKQYKLLKFNLNGKDVAAMVDVRASLTDLLRNEYRMTSVKKGCEVGECGACNVLIDGEAFNSCIYLAVWAEGKHVRTLESLLGPNGELSDIQQAFVDETAIQCGFCIPGFLMTAVEILESGKMYSDEQLRKLLSGHLCRCTGYENIFKAVKKTMYRRHGLEWDGTFDEEQYGNGTTPTNPYF
jgi:carbon-monoxide dehydrogenase small subunit